MLQKTTHWIIDRLVERALPSVGSFLASALQRMLILGHAEHHHQLEEQARRYEAAGKPHLAKLIRDSAQQMTLSDPFSSAGEICERLSADCEAGKRPPLVLPETPDHSSRKRGKQKRSATVHDESGNGESSS